MHELANLLWYSGHTTIFHVKLHAFFVLFDTLESIETALFSLWQVKHGYRCRWPTHNFQMMEYFDEIKQFLIDFRCVFFHSRYLAHKIKSFIQT